MIKLSRDSWGGQRNDHAFAVKVVDGGVNCAIEVGDVSEGLVGQLICLQIVPDNPMSFSSGLYFGSHYRSVGQAPGVCLVWSSLT
jgi:hypothetical protein